MQRSKGQDAGTEAAIHTMGDIFADVDMDAENAFNSINRKVMLHLPHHCYLHYHLLRKFIKVIYCRWGEDTF